MHLWEPKSGPWVFCCNAACKVGVHEIVAGLIGFAVKNATTNARAFVAGGFVTLGVTAAASAV